MALLVGPRTSRSCCEYCDNDFGHSPNGKAKTRLRRGIKRRERAAWKKDASNG